MSWILDDILAEDPILVKNVDKKHGYLSKTDPLEDIATYQVVQQILIVKSLIDFILDHRMGDYREVKLLLSHYELVVRLPEQFNFV